MEIAPVAVGTNQFTQVLALHRKYKRWLGPLPYAAFEEYADDGTVLVATEADAVLGYAAYRLPRNEISLIHLCVAEDARGRGVARHLVDRIADVHSSRNGIRVRCRRDFPAADLWPQLDFDPKGDTPGRSLEGALLTLWWRDFGHPNLFTPALTTHREIVALDTDVFLDLVEERAAGRTSREMLAASWVADEFELIITKQVPQEINNQADSDVRARHLARAEGFLRIDAPENVWRPIEKRLLDSMADVVLNDHDRRDIRHLARAAAADARFLVTRDLDLIKRLEPHVAAFGIQLVKPEQLIRLAHERAIGGYQFAAIQGTEFEVAAVTHDDLSSIVQRFLNSADGERVPDLRSRLEPLLAAPDECDVRVIRDTGRNLVGLIAHRTVRDRFSVEVFRAIGATGLTIARQLAFMLRDEARHHGLRGVQVVDDFMSITSLRGLEEEGYSAGSSGWSIATVDRQARAADLQRELGSAPAWFSPKREWSVARQALGTTVGALQASDLEHRFWPMKILDAALDAFLIPIRATYAEALFDVSLSAQTLFPRPTSLGMSREHVYYRASKPLRPSEPPARILWYVSREPGRPGTGAVRACSSLVEVAVGEPDRLHKRFRRLGVYELDDVRRVATDGLASAIRFTDTELFGHAVTFSELKQAAHDLRCRTPFVQSAWAVPPELFEWVYKKGRSDDAPQ